MTSFITLRILSRRNGTGFGLSQPLFITDVSIVESRPESIHKLDHIIENVTGCVVSRELRIRVDAASILLRMAYFYQHILQSVNAPVFDFCHLTQRVGKGVDKDTHWQLVLPAPDQLCSTLALQWLVPTMNAALADSDDIDQAMANAAQTLETVKGRLQGVVPQTTNMIHLLRAAYDLKFPCIELARGTYAVGHGVASRWLMSTITDATSGIGCAIAANKMVTATILRKLSLPVPDHAIAPDVETAVQIASQLRYPVVVKPVDEEQGRGVFAGLRSEATLRLAYEAAQTVSRRILVERHHDGEDYRLSVLNDAVVKVMHRRPAALTGDGRRTVVELLHEMQQSPAQQRIFQRMGKLRLELDDEMLGLLDEQGLTPDAVPALGQTVLLRRKSNISVGGTQHLVPLEAVHPDNLALAVRASKSLGLDLAGIDLISRDIGRPWHENGAVICEVNAQPQLGYRDTPQLYHQILQKLVPADGRIPLYLLQVESRDDFRLKQLLTLAKRLGCNIISGPDGVWRDECQIVFAPADSFEAARSLLLDREARAGLMIMTSEDIMRCGLPAADFKEVVIEAAVKTSSSAMFEQAGRFVKIHLQARSQARQDLSQR